MSGIDLKNPKVLKNYLSCQAKEGKGMFFVKEQVVCFRSEEGMEFVAPDEIAAEYLAKNKVEPVVEAPAVEPIEEAVEIPLSEPAPVEVPAVKYTAEELEPLSDEELRVKADEIGVPKTVKKRETLIEKLTE